MTFSPANEIDWASALDGAYVAEEAPIARAATPPASRAPRTADEILAEERRRALEPTVQETPTTPTSPTSERQLAHAVEELTMNIKDLIAAVLLLNKKLSERGSR
jgi:hypothetical protein